VVATIEVASGGVVDVVAEAGVEVVVTEVVEIVVVVVVVEDTAVAQFVLSVTYGAVTRPLESPLPVNTALTSI